MGYGEQNHLKNCRYHAKKRAEFRTGITLNRNNRRTMIGMIMAGKGVRLDQRCSRDVNRVLHWLEFEGRWILLVYWPAQQEIVTILPTRHDYPYSPWDWKKNTSELMWKAIGK